MLVLTKRQYQMPLLLLLVHVTNQGRIPLDTQTPYNSGSSTVIDVKETGGLPVKRVTLTGGRN